MEERGATSAKVYVFSHRLAQCFCKSCSEVATRDVNGVLYCRRHGIEAKEQHLADEGVCVTMVCHAGFVYIDGEVLSVGVP